MPQDSYHDPRPVVLIVDEGSNPFELACACEVFGARRRPEIGRELYRFRVVTPRRRVAVRDAMFTIGGAGDLGDIDDAHTVIVPNRPDTDTPTHPAVIKAVQRAHQRGARLVGLCTGAYTLAEAGLLDGRPAAVHWQLAGDFRRRHPKVDLQPGRPVRRRRRHPDVRRQRGGAGPGTAHRPPRPRGADRQLRQPPAGVLRLPRRRAAAVHRAARHLTRSARAVTDPGLGPGPTRHGAVRRGPRPSRSPQRHHAAPAVPRRAGHHAAGVAHRRARRPRTPPYRSKESCPWTWSPTAAASGQPPTSAPRCDAEPGSAHLSTAPASRVIDTHVRKANIAARTRSVARRTFS